MVHGYTTIEQSNKLLELGLSPETADMEYLRLKEINVMIGSVPFVKDESEVENSAYDAVYERIPCWSLTALLELMPYFITIKEEGEPDEYYHFQLNRVGSIFHSKWQASYHGLKTERGKTHTRRIHFAVGPKKESETSLDAAFEMICWLIEQGHIKVNK